MIARGRTPVGDWIRLRVGDRVRAIGPEVSTQRFAQFDKWRSSPRRAARGGPRTA
jgi:hypothetical protein